MLGAPDFEAPDYRAVHRKTGISKSTLRSWVRRERARQRAAEADKVQLELQARGNACNDPRVTPAQRVAIESLAMGRTQKEAAAVAGVRPETISRWKREPGFHAALAEVCAALQEDMRYRLVFLRGRVLDRVAELVPEMGDADAIRLFVALLDRTGFPKREQMEIGGAMGVGHMDLSKVPLEELVAGLGLPRDGRDGGDS